MLSQAKKKKCKACRMMFTPARAMQSACSVPCALQQVESKKAKQLKLLAIQEKIETKEKLKKFKRQDYLRKAQHEINKYVRLRDFREGCISCDLPATWGGQWHASHYRSVGAATSIRFNLWNIHKACSVCNNHKSGNIENYTPSIIKKIGIDKFNWLKNQNDTKKYDVDYLERLSAVFRKKNKRLEKKIEMQS